MLILDLWGISFHAVVVFGLVKDLLFKFVLGHCDRYKSTLEEELGNKHCIRYRTIFLKRLTLYLVFKAKLKGQEFKISPFVVDQRSLRGSQMSKKKYFS